MGTTVFSPDQTFKTLPCAPTVTTIAVDPSSITATSAVLNGTVSNFGGASVISHESFNYTKSNPYFTYGGATGLDKNVTVTGPLSAPGDFHYTLTGLTCDTKYVYQATAASDYPASTRGLGKSGGGDALTFTTNSCSTGTTGTGTTSTGTVTPPVLTQVVATQITDTMATLSTSITNLGGVGESVHTRFEYGTDTNYNSKISAGVKGATGVFTLPVSGLTCNTLYFLRAVAFNSSNTETYFPGASFRTSACATGTTSTGTTGTIITPPIGTLVSFQGSTCTVSLRAQGDYKGTTTNGSCRVSDVAGATIVKNIAAYFAQVFTVVTTTTTTAPSVSVAAVSSTTQTGATLTANLVSPGGAGVNNTLSFDYGLTINYGSSISAGTRNTTGAFSANLTALLCGNTYHVRAKAVNSAGNAFGSDISFPTNACNSTTTVTAPVLTAAVPTGVTQTSVTLSSSLTNLGGTGVTNTLSFEYGTSASYGSTISAGTKNATGTFSVNLTGLTCNTRYYARSKAVNSAGTTNGGGTIFTTGLCSTTTVTPPTITTKAAAAVDSHTETLQGAVTSLGGWTGSITVGYQYGLTTNYILTMTARTITAATSAVPYLASGLMPNTTYHYRIFVKNSTEAYVYGSDMTFKTKP